MLHIIRNNKELKGEKERKRNIFLLARECHLGQLSLTGKFGKAFMFIFYLYTIVIKKTKNNHTITEKTQS